MTNLLNTRVPFSSIQPYRDIAELWQTLIIERADVYPRWGTSEIKKQLKKIEHKAGKTCNQEDWETTKVFNSRRIPLGMYSGNVGGYMQEGGRHNNSSLSKAFLKHTS